MLIWIAEQKFWNLIFLKSFAEDEWHTPAGKQSHQKPPLPPTTSPRGASTSPSQQEPMSPSNDSLEPVQTLSRFWRHQWILSYPLTPQVKQHWHPDSQNKSQDPGLLFLLWFSPASSPVLFSCNFSCDSLLLLFPRSSLTRQPRPQRKASQMRSPRRSSRERWGWWRGSWWWWRWPDWTQGGKAEEGAWG